MSDVIKDLLDRKGRFRIGKLLIVGMSLSVFAIVCLGTWLFWVRIADDVTSFESNKLEGAKGRDLYYRDRVDLRILGYADRLDDKSLGELQEALKDYLTNLELFSRTLKGFEDAGYNVDVLKEKLDDDFNQYHAVKADLQVGKHEKVKEFVNVYKVRGDELLTVFTANDLEYHLSYRIYQTEGIYWDLRIVEDILRYSVSCYLSTGKVEWKNRYEKCIAIYEQKINEAGEIYKSENLEFFVDGVRKSNINFCEIEARSLKLYEAGKVVEAKALLLSSEYLLEIDAYKSVAGKALAKINAKSFYKNVIFYGIEVLLIIGIITAVIRIWIRVLKQMSFTNELNEYFTTELESQTKQLTEMTRQLENENKVQRSTQAELEKRKVMLNNIINAIPDLIYIKDENGYFVDCNMAFCSFLNAQKEAIIGKTESDFFPKDLADFFRQQDKIMMLQVEPKRHEEWVDWPVNSPNATRILLETFKAPFFLGMGRPYGILCISRDVTERFRNEEKLMEAKRVADSANKAKSDFLANMSHELRTPLNSIMGFSDVLREQYFGALNEKQMKYANNVYDSGKHLLAIINDILDISKVESGKMRQYLSVASLDDILRGTLTVIKEKAANNRVELRCMISPEIANLLVVVDARHLKQIVYNLLSNAAKFTPEGGSIELSCEQGAVQDGVQMLQVKVKDTGIGLSLENLGKVFENFYQVESQLTDKTEGTGLGLPLTKQLVKLGGGDICVESEGLNKGCVFTFTMPILNGYFYEKKMGSKNIRFSLIHATEDETKRFLRQLLTEPLYKTNEVSVIRVYSPNTAFAPDVSLIEAKVLSDGESFANAKIVWVDGYCFYAVIDEARMGDLEQVEVALLAGMKSVYPQETLKLKTVQLNSDIVAGDFWKLFDEEVVKS